MRTLFIILLLFSVTNVNAAYLGGSFGVNDIDVDGISSVDGFQVSLFSLSAVERLGFGTSFYSWSGESNQCDAMFTGLSGFLTYEVVSEENFQIHLFLNSPTYYSGNIGERRDDAITDASRSFSGHVGSYFGPIILISPNGHNYFGIKGNISPDVSGVEFMVTF